MQWRGRVSCAMSVRRKNPKLQDAGRPPVRGTWWRGCGTPPFRGGQATAVGHVVAEIGQQVGGDGVEQSLVRQRHPVRQPPELAWTGSRTGVAALRAEQLTGQLVRLAHRRCVVLAEEVAQPAQDGLRIGGQVLVAQLGVVREVEGQAGVRAARTRAARTLPKYMST